MDRQHLHLRGGEQKGGQATEQCGVGVAGFHPQAYYGGWLVGTLRTLTAQVERGGRSAADELYGPVDGGRCQGAD